MLQYIRYSGCLLRITYAKLIEVGLLTYIELNKELGKITEDRVNELFSVFCVYGKMENVKDKVEAIYHTMIQSMASETDIEQLSTWVNQIIDKKDIYITVKPKPLDVLIPFLQNDIRPSEIMELTEKELYCLFFAKIKQNQERLIANRFSTASAIALTHGGAIDFAFERNEKLMKALDKSQVQEVLDSMPKGLNPKELFKEWE